MIQFYVMVIDEDGNLWEFIPVANNIPNLNKAASASLQEAAEKIRIANKKAGELN